MVGDRTKFNETIEETKDVIGEELIKWILDNGGELSKLELKQYAEEVRGVHTLHTLKAGEMVLSIPRKCCITVEMGKHTEIGKKILQENLDFVAPKHIFLLIFLLTDMEKGADSFFQPYYKSLPSTLKNMPIFWSDEELEWLEGSFILQQIQDRKESIEHDYQKICQVDSSFSRFSLQQFSWARMIVCSRNFGLSIDQNQTAALVPFADMLNHFRPRETSWTFDQVKQSFTIHSMCNIQGGAQVYDSYGKKCNHRFLLNYGFAIEDNVEECGQNPNEIMMFFSIDENDPDFLKKEKMSFLAASGNDCLEFRMSKRHTDPATREAFAIARVLVATHEELIMMGESMIVAHKTPPLSVDNEIRVLSLLSKLMQNQMDAFPTTIEEDDKLLASGDILPFTNQRHSLIFVRGEKDICLHYIKLADTMIPLLRLPWIESYRRIKTVLCQADDDILLYGQDIVVYLISLEHRSSMLQDFETHDLRID